MIRLLAVLHRVLRDERFFFAEKSKPRALAQALHLVHRARERAVVEDSVRVFAEVVGFDVVSLRLPVQRELCRFREELPRDRARGDDARFLHSVRRDHARVERRLRGGKGPRREKTTVSFLGGNEETQDLREEK